MKINVDFTGLEIANEEMRGYFRKRSRAEDVRRANAPHFDHGLDLACVRYRLPIAGHEERDFWIIVDPDGQPVWASDHLKSPQQEDIGDD